MRLGDLDALKDRFSLTGPIGVSVRKVIDKQPTIDAVPVVRCKDCALLGKLGCPMDEWVKPDDNGFCHHGKRKDGEC